MGELIKGFCHLMEDSIFTLMTCKSIPTHLIDMSMDYYEPIYFMSIHEKILRIGMNIKVTNDQQRLAFYWKECELGNIGEKYLEQYLNKIGKITKIDEDDQTVQLRWGNYLTAWIPIQACCLAKCDDQPSIFADFSSTGRVM